MDELHLSSLVVHALPERLAEVEAALGREGCEVHARSDAGKLVVTRETADSGTLSGTITRIQLLPGVLAATLVFHHVEEGSGDAPAPSSGGRASGPRPTQHTEPTP
jgi:nitrate reductase NapD